MQSTLRNAMSTSLMTVILLASLSVDVSHLSRVGLSEAESCHLETCSIGTEYCDEIEERCSPCTETVCQLSPIQPACEHKCKELKEEKTKRQEGNSKDGYIKRPVIVPEIYKNVADQNYTSSPSRLQSSELLVWKVIAGIAVALLIIVILAIIFIHKLPRRYRQWISKKILRITYGGVEEVGPI